MLQASVDAQQHIMAPTKRPDLLTVPQAAQLLGKTFTLEGVRAAIKRGRLEAHRYGTVYLIERSALESYRDTRKMGRPPGTKKKPSAGRSKKKS
jgi:excisionase family DNA binding protein